MVDVSQAGFAALRSTLKRLGSAAPSVPLWLVALGTAQSGEPTLARFEFTQPQMGVPFRIVLYAPDAATATNAAAAAFARVRQLNDRLSDYEYDSELSRLSRSSGQGQPQPVSPDLWFLLDRSQALARQTDGAFDITVGPAVNLWRRARRRHELPTAELIDQVRARIGYRQLRLQPESRTASLELPDMRLDLGGIAKGYAVDQALQVLFTNGISHALVAGAGDIRVGAPPPGQNGWRIEVAPIDHTNAPPARYILLKHAALATSGDVFQRLEIDGQRYSHIIDPRTALALTNSCLVSVLAPDCTTADSLATAVSVLGPEKGLELIQQTSGCEACLAWPSGDRILTVDSPGFSRVLCSQLEAGPKSAPSLSP